MALLTNGPLHKRFTCVSVGTHVSFMYDTETKTSIKRNSLKGYGLLFPAWFIANPV